jgi:hypothetical protein
MTFHASGMRFFSRLLEILRLQPPNGETGAAPDRTDGPRNPPCPAPAPAGQARRSPGLAFLRDPITANLLFGEAGWKSLGQSGTTGRAA